MIFAYCNGSAVNIDCVYIVCERLGGSYREMSFALPRSKWRWQHSNVVTLRMGLVTCFPVTEGTFLEAPCKAFLFVWACYQGNVHSGSKIGFTFYSFFFYIASGTTSTNSLQLYNPTASFDGHERILGCEGSVYWYDETYFILKVYSVLILESCTT